MIASTPAEAERSAPLPGARTALILLIAINLLNYLDRYVLSAVERRIRAEFFPNPDDELAKALTGSLAFAFMASYLVTAPVFGWLADRTSRWLLIAGGIVVWSLASGGSGLAATFAMLFITRCLVGVGEASYGPAAPALIADLYPVKVRGSVLAWFYMAIPVGSALGYALGGAIAQLTDSWRWPFYIVVAPGLVLALLCGLMKEPRRGQADAVAPPRTAGIRDYRVLLRTPSYVLCTLGMAAMSFAVGGIAYWAPTYLMEERGQSDEAQVNLIFGAVTAGAGLIATLLGGIAGDRLRDRYPGSYFLVSGIGMLAGFVCFLLFLWTPMPWAWGLMFLAVFCLFFNTGPTNTILANVTHPSIRASAFALNILVIHALGDAVSPGIIGYIAGVSRGSETETTGLKAGFLAVSAVMLLSGLLWLWGARYLKRDTEAAPTRL